MTRRCMKLDVRINLFDEVEVSVGSAYSPLPKHLIEEFADMVRKFAADNLEELTDPNSTLPTAVSVAIPPQT